MAGHRKWSKVKYIKGPLNVKSGAAFNKLVKEITGSVRLGGGDHVSGNFWLRSLVDLACAVNMPKEKVERVVEKGRGELEGTHYEETLYEGYALGGVALIIEAATDNKNRMAADLRLIFQRKQWQLGGKRQRSLPVPQTRAVHRTPLFDGRSRFLEPTLDAGAEDVTTGDGHYMPSSFRRINFMPWPMP